MALTRLLLRSHVAARPAANSSRSRSRTLAGTGGSSRTGTDRPSSSDFPAMRTRSRSINCRKISPHFTRDRFDLGPQHGLLITQ